MARIRYPYYIVSWTEGRLSGHIPLKFRHTPMERMLKNGKIGGKKTTEQEFIEFEIAYRFWARKRMDFDVSMFMVNGPGKPRQRINPLLKPRPRGESGGISPQK